MTEPLYRVVYCSRNLLGGNDAAQNAAIDGILQKARSNNSRRGVTGALLYNAGFFAQVLEGPRAHVETIFETIQRDRRHGEVTVLDGSDAEGRDFPDWSMAHVEPATQADAGGIATTLHRAMRDPDAAGHDVLNMMRSLIVQAD